MDFIVNFLLFPVVKEFGKSVEIWRSYCHEFGGTLFETRCRFNKRIPQSVHSTLVTLSFSLS